MRRVVCVLVLLLLAVAGCGGEPEPDIAVEPTNIPRTEKAEPPEPLPPGPLTGVPVKDEQALSRPVLAVKIDNAPKARPQVSLDEADVVIEELVEGGVTRFIGLFHSIDPDTVGPVRSGREVDADLLPAFAPVFGLSGAAGPTYEVLREAGLTLFEEGQAGGAFYRDDARPRPHNLFATAAKLWAAADQLPAAERAWPFAEEPPAGGEAATDVTVRFSHVATSSWTWDAAGAAWLRSQDGTAHKDDSGQQLRARNVVIVRVPVSSGGGVDSFGAPTRHIDVLGEGEALVLRDGRTFSARWRKESPTDQFQWLDETGAPLPLGPGRTWLELVPVSGGVDVQRPPEATAPASSAG